MKYLGFLVDNGPCGDSIALLWNLRLDVEMTPGDSL